MSTDTPAESDTHDAPWRDAATLRREYCRRGHERTDLAERWGCSPKTIDKWLRKHDITKMEGQPWQDKETLEYLYCERGYTQAEIARWFPVVGQSVGNWIRRYDLEREHPDRQYSNGDLVDHLQDVHEQADYRVTMRDLKTADGPSPKPYRNRWGSWTAALEAAGIDPDARTRPPAQSDRETLDNDQAHLLTARREAALELRRTADPWRFHEADLSESDFYTFLHAGIIRAASSGPTRPADDEPIDYWAYEWELAQGVRGWVDSHLGRARECPGAGCESTGIRNPKGVEGYRCTNGDCDEVLTREQARELIR